MILGIIQHFILIPLDKGKVPRFNGSKGVQGNDDFAPRDVGVADDTPGGGDGIEDLVVNLISGSGGSYGLCRNYDGGRQRGYGVTF